MLEHYLSLATRAIFVENMALAFFLGMCSFLAISKNVFNAIGMGAAVVVVLALTCPLNNVLNEYLLAEGALSSWFPGAENINIGFLTFLVLIGTIAAVVQIVEMIIERFSPGLYGSLGVFLPLIAVNCSILGGSLFMVQREYTLAESAVFGTGAGLGFAIAIVALASIRERLHYSNVPAPLRGLGITFIIVGLMSIGFMSFSGIQL